MEPTPSPIGRRQFAGLLAGLGVLPAGIATRRAVAGDTAESSETTTQMVSIPGGNRPVGQADFTGGSIPSDPPPTESVSTPVAAAAWLEARARHTAAAELVSACTDLAGSNLLTGGVNPGVFSVTTRVPSASGDLPTLVIDCPAGVDVKRLNAVAASRFTERAAEAVETELDFEALAERLDGRFSADEIRAVVSAVRTDLTVRFRRRPGLRWETGCHTRPGRASDAQYREQGIAMGAAVRSETRGSIASAGFRGLRAGHAVLVTTAHTFYDQDVTAYSVNDLRGATLYQAEPPHAVGQCHALEHNGREAVDAAAVAIDTDTYPSRYLAARGGNRYADRPLVGAASWELLETYQAEGRPIYKQGATTGRCAGRITELREFPSGVREFGVDIHSNGGDSGGPYFVETDDGFLIAGIHRAVSSSGLRVGVFVGSILDALDISLY